MGFEAGGREIGSVWREGKSPRIREKVMRQRRERREFRRGGERVREFVKDRKSVV